jgi:hypothetical protein
VGPGWQQLREREGRRRWAGRRVKWAGTGDRPAACCGYGLKEKEEGKGGLG